MRLLTGRSSPSPPGKISNSLQSADLAQPGIPANGDPEVVITYQTNAYKQWPMSQKYNTITGSKSQKITINKYIVE